MLERIASREQVRELYTEFILEDNWYWWIEGAYPDYSKFENWVAGCDSDNIGIFLNKYKVSNGEYKTLGFSQFYRTSLIHGISHLTIWILPSLRKNRGLVPYGIIATADALNFTFLHFPIRKVYQNVIINNVASIRPISRKFQREGDLNQYYFINGDYHDVAIFSVSRHDWGDIYGKYQKKLEPYF